MIISIYVFVNFMNFIKLQTSTYKTIVAILKNMQIIEDHLLGLLVFLKAASPVSSRPATKVLI